MNTPSLQDHMIFWATLSRCLHDGKTLNTAFDEAHASLVNSPLEPVVKQMAGEIRGGLTLSAAMGRHDHVFPRSIRTMARAGEVGGVMDVIAGRISEGLANGSLLVTGGTPGTADEQARFWDTFGMLLSSGVPILEAINVVGEGVCDAKLLEALRAIHKGVMEGRTLSETMRTFPDVFRPEVCSAADAGERAGELDSQALRIAAALRAGNLASLLPPQPAEPASMEGDEPVVVSTLNRVFSQAVRDRASDIHFDPTEADAGHVRLRIDGVLRPFEPLPPGLFPNLIRRVKIMCNLNVAESRLPQDAQLMIHVDGKHIGFAVSVVPTIAGERIVMRIMYLEQIRLSLEDIGLRAEDLQTVKRLCSLPSGIVIANGKTGSGKTTLLYSMVMEIDRDAACVMTIEDPVEFRLPGVAHVEIKPQIGFTYQRALIHVLRQSPNVIMVGELRDLETVELTIQAALTGHLVFTTMHAGSSVEALQRLLDIGIKPFMVNSSIAAVITQNLVRLLCNCKRPAKLTFRTLPPQIIEFVKRSPDATFFEPCGCEQCHGTGFRGRTAIHEILVMNDEIRQVFGEADTMPAVHEAALHSGMRTLLQDGLRKAAAGLISVDELLRVLPLRHMV